MLNYLKTWIAEKLNTLARILTSREQISVEEYQLWLDKNPWITHQGHIECIKLHQKLSSQGSNNDVFMAERWLTHGINRAAITENQTIVIKFCIPYAPPGKNRHHKIDQVVASFQDEVRINNLIKETNIEGVVRPLGGSWAGRIPLLKMEFVPGHSLDKEIDVLIDSIEFHKRLARLAYLANTISQLHHYHIYHHDIKPQNILLCKNPAHPQDGKLLLLDFGYAKARLRDYVSKHEGQLSPIYMAPEQALLSQQHLTCSTDYFSFGIVAHEYLTGQPLFPKCFEIFLEDGYTITTRYLDHLRTGAQNRIDKSLYPEVYDLIQRLTIFDSQTRLELCPSPFDIAYVFQNIAKRMISNDPNIDYLDHQLDYYKQQQEEYDNKSKNEVSLAYVENIMTEVRKRTGKEISDRR